MKSAWPAASLGLLLAMSFCAPPPPPPPPAPVVRRVPPSDWFQRQLAAANTARRAHQPASDKAGAQSAYDGIVHAACQRVAIEGPDKYKSRCDKILATNPDAPTPAPDPFSCDGSGDDETLRACND